MDFKGKRVLLLDGYAKQVCGMLRNLNDLGCSVTTINYSKLDIGYSSKYPVKKILAPECKNNHDALITLIDKEIRSNQYDVVFPILEETTEIVTKNSSEYEKYVKIAAAPYNAFMKAYDKQETMRVCMTGGVPCPVTRLDGEDIESFISKGVFPLALKPRQGSGSVGFHFVQSPEELRRLISDGTVKPDEYIIQEYIDHSDKHFVSYMVLDENHEVKSSLVTEKIRWFPLDAGPSSFMGTVDNVDIEKYSERLLKAMEWTGFAQVYYITDPKDKIPKVIEINGRIPASMKILGLCGINGIRQILECAYGIPVTAYKPNTKQVYLRQIQTDLLWFLKSPERFKSKPSWFSVKNTKDYIFSIRDPKPFFTYSIQCLKRYRKDMKKRSR